MLIAEFVDALKLTPRDWRLEHGAIRRGGVRGNTSERQCPITAVCGECYTLAGSITLAASHLGLVDQDFWNILDAADNGTGGSRNAKVGPLRKQLLEACGLKEE